MGFYLHPITYGCNGEQVKYTTAILPGVRVTVFAQAFVVEAVHFGDLPGLVVAAQ